MKWFTDMDDGAKVIVLICAMYFGMIAVGVSCLAAVEIAKTFNP